MSAETDVTLSMLDRIVEPLRHQMGEINSKLDRVVEMGGRFQGMESNLIDMKARMNAAEITINNQALELAAMRGSHSVISWVLSLIGAPAVGAMILAGIASVFHIQIGAYHP